MSAGKGSSPRPFSVPYEEYSNNWNNIFGKRTKCSYAKKYKAKRKPKCGCQECEEKYAQSQNTEQYHVPVEQTPEGEFVITLPDKLLNRLGWSVGDEIEWTKEQDGYLAKKKGTKHEN